MRLQLRVLLASGGAIVLHKPSVKFVYFYLYHTTTILLNKDLQLRTNEHITQVVILFFTFLFFTFLLFILLLLLLLLCYRLTEMTLLFTVSMSMASSGYWPMTSYVHCTSSVITMSVAISRDAYTRGA